MFAEHEENPNELEYQRALAAGEFDSLAPETFVAISGGQLVGTSTDKEQLFQQLNKQGILGQDILYCQPGVPDREVCLRSPRIVR